MTNQPTIAADAHGELLAAIGDGLITELLQIHHPMRAGGLWTGWPVCAGCATRHDLEPLWPCRTVRVIATQVDATLADAYDITDPDQVRFWRGSPLTPSQLTHANERAGA